MIFLDSTTTIRLTALADTTGAFINNATVTATISDLDGNEIATVELASSGSDGNYAGNVTPEDTASMQPQAEYLVDVVSVLDDATIDHRRETHIATYRGFAE